MTDCPDIGGDFVVVMRQSSYGQKSVECTACLERKGSGKNWREVWERRRGG